MSRQRSVLTALGIVSVLATGVVFSYITHSYAGFEWVPATPSSPAVKEVPAEAGASSIEIEPALPLPDIPVKQEQLLPPTPTPVDMKPLPVLHDSVDQASPAMRSLQIQKSPEDKSSPLVPHIQRIQIQPSGQPPVISEATQETVHWQQKERLQSPVYEPLPPIEEENIESAVNLSVPPVREPLSTIMLPEDAPVSAQKQIDLKGQSGVVLKPFAEKSFVESSKIDSETIIPEIASYETVLGFGNNTPLAFALRQIVPDDYSFSFGRRVNPGTSVSWNGGEPWNKVIVTMISPLGLRLSIKGKNVLIYSADQSVLEHVEKPSSLENPETVLAIKNDNIKVVSTPVSLLSENSTSSKRMNILAPSESISIQPEETMTKIDRLADADQILQRVEPTAGNNINVVSPSRTGYFWEGAAGQSAKTVIEEWTNQANIELLWKASHDFTISHDLFLSGSFDIALQTLITEGLQEDVTPEIALIKTPEGPKTARLIVR